MQRGWSAGLAMGVLLLGGCSGALRNAGQAEQIIAAYEQRDQAQVERSPHEDGIVRLERRSTGDGALFTLELAEAPREGVIRRLLEEAGQPWELDGVLLHGRVSARFDETPLPRILQRLLRPIGLAVDRSGPTLRIHALAWDAMAPLPEIARVVELNHIDGKEAIILMNGLYADKNNRVPLSFGVIPDGNAVYLRGREDHLFLASQMLAMADRPRQHVVIEALVADYSVGDLRAMGSQLLGLASGRFDQVGVSYSNVGNLITFTRNGTGESRSLSFSGVINAMISDSKAHVISRPYVATLSGKQAEMEVAGERHYLTHNGNDPSITKVDAGVRMMITPTVLSDGRIRMVLEVEDSMFSNAGAEVVVETSRNSAKSVVQVQNGQTLVIGGMIRNRHATSNSGFPLLRLIPGLNLLFARQSDDYIRKEVVMLLTPHLWEPGVEPPLQARDVMDGPTGRARF